MTEPMTLVDVRDWHRFSAEAAALDGHTKWANTHNELADAIDAHLAQPAQAVDAGADFHAMNDALCAFSMRWEIDGDYMKCRTCKRNQITNYASHDFPHAHECQAAGKVEARPWETFAQLLSPLTRAISGAKARPVDGWKLVPSDPTQSMTVAGFECDAWDELSSAVVHTGGWPFSCRESAACVTAIYKAMLAASPAPDKEG